MIGMKKKALKNFTENGEDSNPLLDLEVPNLPYSFPVSNREYDEMLTYFVQKYMQYHLNKGKEEDYGYNLYP